MGSLRRDQTQRGLPHPSPFESHSDLKLSSKRTGHIRRFLVPLASSLFDFIPGDSSGYSSELLKGPCPDNATHLSQFLNAYFYLSKS